MRLRTPLSRPGGATSTRRSRWSRRRGAPGGRSRSGSSATPPTCSTSCPARHHPRRGHRPDERPRSHPRLPAQGWTLARGASAATDPPHRGPAKASMAAQVRAMLASARGAAVFDYGNNLRQMAKDAGVADAFAFPGFVPAYMRPLFCRGYGPFRWVALSGDPADIARDRREGEGLIPDDPHLHRWLDLARGADRVPGAAGPDLLAGLGTAPARPGLQRDGAQRRSDGARSSSAATTSTPARSRARTARPRRCATGPTPSPTGRS